MTNQVPSHQINLNKSNNVSNDVFSQQDNNALELKLPGKFDLLDDLMDTILKENLKFSFSDYMKSIFQSKSKSSILYLNGIKNLDFMMDIERYLKLYLDMSFIKEALLDETQRLVLDTSSKLVNLKKLFFINYEKSLDFFEYQREDFEIFFRGLKSMFSRHNDTDNKIIKFIEKRLEI